MARSQRLDGWTNLATGLGDPLRDKRLAAQPVMGLLRQPQAELLWRSSDMAARAVEKIPQDALRRGFSVVLREDDDETETEDIDGDVEAIDGKKAPDWAEWANQLPGPMAEQRPLGPGFALKPSRTDANVTDPTMATEGQDDSKATTLQERRLNERMERLGAEAAVREAAKFERAYGGAAILLGTVDRSPGKSPNMFTRPLNLDFVDELRFLTVLTPMELVPYRYYGDPLAPKYGEVQLWTMVPKSKGINPRPSVVRVHESRLVLFKGVRTSRFMVEMHRGFGDSVLNRIWQHVRNFDTGFDSAAVLINEFAHAVWKMKGLVEMLQADGQGLVQKRAQMMSYVRSVLNTTVIDQEEDFERKATPVTGLPELLDRLANRLAASTGMPVTMLMGQEPAGLNATGKANRDWYNENVAELQRDKILPALKRIIDVEIHATEGIFGGKPPKGWDVVMPPLEQPSETEEADIGLKNAQADALMLDRGVVHPEEVAKSRYGKKDSAIQLDPEVRKAALEAQQVQEERSADLHEQQMEGGQQTAPPFGGKPKK